MALIDQTYFKKRLTAIPNLNQPTVENDLNNNIAIYDPEYLVNVLGQELNDEFEEGLVPEFPDQIWLDLRDGADFEYCNVKYKWKGFLRTTKESPISFYVMWYYMKQNNEYLTSMGMAKGSSENSEVISPINRMVAVWQRMKQENVILEKFLKANESDYPSYDPVDTLTKSINIYGI